MRLNNIFKRKIVMYISNELFLPNIHSGSIPAWYMCVCVYMYLKLAYFFFALDLIKSSSHFPGGVVKLACMCCWVGGG